MIFSLLHRATIILLFALIVGCILPSQSHSQTPNLTPQIHPIPISGLPVIPELHTDMTLEAFIGYVYLDSIARTIGIETAVNSPENMTVHELQAISRYIYGMGDYNPILLLRHFTSTADSNFPDTRYASYPANTFFNLLLAIDKQGDKFGREYALLVMSAYALHVRVTDVVSGMDTVTFPRPFPYTNIACEIIEPFKGKIAPNNCNNTPLPINEKTEAVLTPSQCVVYGQPYDDSGRYYIPKVGEELIIFLYLEPLIKGKAHLYRFIGQEPNNGVFRIVNGKVQDTGNVWGLGTEPSFNDFRNTLLNKISTIKNWKL